MRALLLATLTLATVAHAQPGYRAPPEPTDPLELAARFEAAIRQRDATGVEQMLTDPLLYDSLWFADSTCALRFARRGTLEGKDVRALARCLAQQKLIVSTRRSSLPRGAIITLDPGIELEVMFKADGIAYLGRPHPTDAKRSVPVLTVQTFEALRKTGTTRLDVALAPKRTNPASAWIEVCLDKTGAVSSSTVVEARPDLAAGPTFLAAIADWTFAPFKLRGVPTAACSLTLLSYPASTAPAIEALPAPASLPIPITRVRRLDEDDGDLLTIKPYPGAPPKHVPLSELEKLRRSGTTKIDPDSKTQTMIANTGRSSVMASLELCVDEAGYVSGVTGLKSSGFPDYDDKLSRAMWKWTFKPYVTGGASVPVCTAVNFIYRPKMVVTP